MCIRFNIVILTFLISLLGLSCADEYDYSYVLNDNNYLPLEKGKYIIYSSDSIIYRGGGSVKDTITSFLKIENIDTFLNTAGERIVVRHHWYKYKDEEAWKFKKRSSAFLRDQNVLSTEDNITLVKLPLFPRKNMKFVPTIYVNPDLEVEISGEIFTNLHQDWNGKILDIATPYAYENNKINACRVQMVADTLLKIQKRKVVEIYGNNIGLLERDEVFLFDDQSGNAPIEVRAKKGFIHKLQIMEYN